MHLPGSGGSSAATPAPSEGPEDADELGDGEDRVCRLTNTTIFLNAQRGDDDVRSISFVLQSEVTDLGFELEQNRSVMQIIHEMM